MAVAPDADGDDRVKDPGRDEGMGPIGRATGRIADIGGRYALIAAAAVVLVLMVLSTEVFFEPPTVAATGTSDSGLAAALSVFWSLVSISLATGLVSLAFVTTLKYLGSIRGWFHQTELLGYLGETAFDALRTALHERSFGTNYAERSKDTKKRRLGRERRHIRYVMNLPLELLAGQMVAATELAVMAVNPPPDSEGARAAGVARTAAAPTPGDVDLLTSLAQPPDAAPVAGPPPGPSDGTPPEWLGQMDTVELLQRTQRSIDTLQIVIGHRWRWFLRATSMAMCAPVAWLMLSFTDAPVGTRAVGTVVATIVGGWFSWVLRDIVAGIERWRR